MVAVSTQPASFALIVRDLICLASPPGKRSVSNWLPTLLQANLDSLFADVRGVDDRLTAHGIPSFQQTRAAAIAALEELVLPGFTEAGLDIRSARAWTIAHLPPG